jgi:hypothetical protein
MKINPRNYSLQMFLISEFHVVELAVFILREAFIVILKSSSLREKFYGAKENFLNVAVSKCSNDRCKEPSILQKAVCKICNTSP